VFPGAPLGLNPESTRWRNAEEAGYATACIGKWHLATAGFLPHRRGFDYFGPAYSNDMGRARTDPRAASASRSRPRRRRSRSWRDFGRRNRTERKRATPLPLLENEKVIARVRQDEQQGLVERYTTPP